MFDIWLGAITLFIQLLLCFKVKSRLIRFIPIIIFSLLAVVFVIQVILLPAGWDKLGYAIFTIYAVFLIFICGIGWGIWALTKLKK